MRDRLKLFLQEILPGVDFECSDTLVDDGIVDSLMITTIIAEVSMEFGIYIPFEELSTKNFNSLDALTALIERCGKQQV
ncbi:MAG: phosphopantetheine-binding protein [Butyrivibrio sp.]|nr:phosphopantetheine-binding protein [Acetatifactor muris]MCM1558924.1 phosphopantetheine-binding protein [Butyrivibrio sp.]